MTSIHATIAVQANAIVLLVETRLSCPTISERNASRSLRDFEIPVIPNASRMPTSASTISAPTHSALPSWVSHGPG